MNILGIKYFRHISQIIQIMQPNLVQKSKSTRSQFNFENKPNFSNQMQLRKEVEQLLANIENLLKYCQVLESQNKKFKTGVSSSNLIYERNQYIVDQDSYENQKNLLLSRIYSSDGRLNQFQSFEKDSQELRNTRQLYLGSLSKIHSLKNQVAGLSEKLSFMYKVYEKHEIDETDDTQKRDMFLTEHSLLPYNSKQSFQNNDELDLEHLLCHEELSMDELYTKQNNSTKYNSDQSRVDNLLSKGISFRQAKTLRSSEFINLNSIIQKYRLQTQSSKKTIGLKKNNSGIYR